MALFGVLILTFNSKAQAGGYSEFVVPESVGLVGTQGFRVFGPFGNPGNCAVSNQIFVNKSHPLYDDVYSMVLMAYAAKKKIRFYINGCQVVSWISINSINVLGTSPAQVDIQD